LCADCSSSSGISTAVDAAYISTAADVVYISTAVDAAYISAAVDAAYISTAVDAAYDSRHSMYLEVVYPYDMGRGGNITCVALLEAKTGYIEALKTCVLDTIVPVKKNMCTSTVTYLKDMYNTYNMLSTSLICFMMWLVIGSHNFEGKDLA